MIRFEASPSVYGSAVCLVVTAILTPLMSTAHAQKSYQTPEVAVSALVEAVKAGSKSQIKRVLGPDADEIVDSGDEMADAETRQRFLSAYDAKHSFSFEGNKKASIILGADDFPFPIPLTHNQAGWEFDTAAGRREILYRRIGRNELDAIQTCLAFVDAQNEYADKDRTGGARASTPNALPAAPARRMGCSGATIATKAHWANSRRRRRRRATRSEPEGSPTTAIFIGS